MHTRKMVTMIVAVVLMFSVGIADDFKAEQPILITAAGQSADVLMVKVLAKKSGLDYIVEKLAKPSDLENAKSLIIVSGGSTKGLGAAKIDKNDELERIEGLIAAANKKEIPIITMHVGGKARRGKLSDEFNLIAAEAGSYLVVVEGGNGDGFFSGIAEKNEVPIIIIKKIIHVQSVLTDIFGE